MSDRFNGCTFCRRQALHVEELEEKIRQLEGQLYGDEWQAPMELRLTAGQEAILRGLVSRDRVCSINFLIEITRGVANTHHDYPDDECIRTQISHMRKKLTPFGLVIETQWARGYRLTPDTRNRLLSWNTPARDAA